MSSRKEGKRKDRNSGGNTPDKEKRQAKISKFLNISSQSEKEILEITKEDNIPEVAIEEDKTNTKMAGTSAGTSASNKEMSKKEEVKQLMADIDHKLERLDTLHAEITDLKKVVHDLMLALNYSEEQYVETGKKISTLCEENQVLKTHIITQNQQNSILYDRMVEQEDYSRRENLIICGIKEARGENCFIVVQDFFQHMGFEHVFIQRCHRVGIRRQGGERDILVRLLHFQEKMKIMNSRSKLPSGIYINDDHSPETKRKINVLRLVYKEAKKIDPTTTLAKDKLYFKNKLYTTKNLHSININTEKLSIKQTQNTIAFAGRFSPLSNLAPCSIDIDGSTYPSSEHYYQHTKCLTAGNIRAASAVLLSSDPEEAMAAGSVVKQPTEWTLKDGVTIMERVLRVKVSPNHMKAVLRSTGNKMIVEATRNSIWGIGQPFTSPNVLQPETYNGQNLLGVILMKIRDELVLEDSGQANTPL